MQVYKKDPSYLVSYDIKDDQIIQHYYKDKELYPVPNIPHNLEICDRKLLNQFQQFKEDSFDDIKIDRNIAIANLIIPDIIPCFLMAFYSKNIILAAFDTAFISREIYRIVKLSRKKQHFELTSFCLEHALEIKELSKTPNHLPNISKKAQKILDEDQGFTLNHSDKYRIKDLKQLKKAIDSK